MRVQNGTATLENSLAVSNKVKHTLTIDLVIPHIGIYPRKVEMFPPSLRQSQSLSLSLCLSLSHTDTHTHTHTHYTQMFKAAFL